MGLDITAYKNLKKVENPELDEEGFPVNWDSEYMAGGGMDWSESVWPKRGDGLDAHTVYSYDDSFDFRAGSYGGYNMWRSQLEKFKGDVAFQELIDSAVNEGVIGSVVSKKLYNDFVTNEKEAIVFAVELGELSGDYWIAKYYDWKKAFEYAQENGCVDFH